MPRFSQIAVQSTNRVKIITLNRPDKRNALGLEMIQELLEALGEAASCGCGVVILTGAGSAFSLGIDLEQLRTLDTRPAEEHRLHSEKMALLLRTLHDFPKPVIAAVNGPAIADGMSLATIPDFTLAVPEAKFGWNEVRIGIAPALAAPFLLRQIGEKRTRALLLTGRMLKPQEALEIGLVTEIVAAEELMQSAQALAQMLLLNSPQAMRAVKQLLARSACRRLDEELEDAIAVNAQQQLTEDCKVGVRAFLEKRRAEWPGLNLLRMDLKVQK
jgi:methylglutaconyl-CoA hydratase